MNGIFFAVYGAFFEVMPRNERENGGECSEVRILKSGFGICA